MNNWKINEQTGAISVNWDALGAAHCLVRSGDKIIDTGKLSWNNGRTADAESGLEIRAVCQADTVQFELVNLSQQDFFVDEILLRFDQASLEVGDYLEYVHSKWLYEAQSTVKHVGAKTDFVEANPESSMVYLLKHRQENRAFMFAALPPQEQDYVYFKALHFDSGLQGKFGVEIKSEQGRLIRPGASARTSKIMFASRTDPMALLESLGDRYAELRERPLRDRVCGWNSWDEIKRDVNADNMLEIQRIAQNSVSEKVKYFVIDDGWQYRWGDWRFRPEFRATGKEFCHRVVEAGSIPGIWLAPLYAESDMMDAHPDWFARKADGSLVVEGEGDTNRGCLDITVPEVREHLFRIYRELKEAGFQYFKVDFTQMVQHCTQFRDMTVGRGHIIRKTFETIREAVGDDSYILACAPPYESVFGLVDAARITADIQIKWSVVQFNIGSAACRWWLDRKLWNNDPDFLVVRSPEFQLNPTDGERYPFERGRYFSGMNFTACEARSWALAAAITGEVVLSDDLRGLNDEGMELLRKIFSFAPLARTAVPTDLFTCGHNCLPSVWLADEGDRKIIAVFNWEEAPENHMINLADYGITEEYCLTDCINQKTTPAITNGRINLALTAHDSVGLIFVRK